MLHALSQAHPHVLVFYNNPTNVYDYYYYRHLFYDEALLVQSLDNLSKVIQLMSSRRRMESSSKVQRDIYGSYSVPHFGIFYLWLRLGANYETHTFFWSSFSVL